jgi:hypothetical protein
VIGLEIGRALHRLGVGVTLFGRLGHVGRWRHGARGVRARRTHSSASSGSKQPGRRTIERVGEARSRLSSRRRGRPHGESTS